MLTELPIELAGSSARERRETANFVHRASCRLSLIPASEGAALLSLWAGCRQLHRLAPIAPTSTVARLTSSAATSGRRGRERETLGNRPASARCAPARICVSSPMEGRWRRPAAAREERVGPGIR